MLLEEVVHSSPSGGSNINNNSPIIAPPNQRMVGMTEMPLQVRNKWKHETKFVLKRVGQDPSWRARLGNLMSFTEELDSPPATSNSASETSRVPSMDQDDQSHPEDQIEDQGNKAEQSTNADQFLVCVFNVSSKVSYR